MEMKNYRKRKLTVLSPHLITLQQSNDEVRYGQGCRTTGKGDVHRNNRLKQLTDTDCLDDMKLNNTL